MNRLASAALAAALALATSVAGAQSYGGYPSNGYEGQSDYARVIRVDPVFNGGYASAGRNDPRCYDNRYSTGGGYNDRSYRGYGADDRYNDGYNDRYEDRYNRSYGGYGGAGRTTATVIGGVVGAVLGSKVGGGSGRYATSALGSMVGGMAGQVVYDQTVRGRTPPRQATIRVCDPVPVNDRYGNDYRSDDYGNVQQYDVTYEYGGRQYTTRTNHHPGDRIRVRVDVRPE